MPDVNLGTKYECYACGAKFYDLGKPEPLCPKCGANQNEAREKEPAGTSPASRQRRKTEVKRKSPDVEDDATALDDHDEVDDEEADLDDEVEEEEVEAAEEEVEEEEVEDEAAAAEAIPDLEEEAEEVEIDEELDGEVEGEDEDEDDEDDEEEDDEEP